MNLTKEENDLFSQIDKELLNPPSFYIEPGLMQAYLSNDESVQIIFGYIKRVLLEVTRKRGIPISENESLDLDDMLKKHINIPERFPDFDPLYCKDYDEIDRYIKEKSEGANSSQLEVLLNDFTGPGGIRDSFRIFMSTYILKFLENIDDLNDEISENSQESLQEDVFSVFKNESNIASNTENEQEDINNDGISEAFESFKDITDLEDVSEDFFGFGTESTRSSENNHKEKFSDEEIIDCIRFINSYPTIMEYTNNWCRVSGELEQTFKSKKLDEFYSDKEFFEEFKKIMDHDPKKNRYHFHGTTSINDANSILKEGLGMVRDDLSSTSYPEFTMDDVILYNRGIDGAVGRDAVVIIDEPLNEITRGGIVRPIENEEEIHFSPSGLQGLDTKPEYIIDSKYIVGYIDKKNRKVVQNSRYYNYDKSKKEDDFIRPKELPYTNDRIAEGVANFNPKELEVRDSQLSK